MGLRQWEGGKIDRSALRLRLTGDRPVSRGRRRHVRRAIAAARVAAFDDELSRQHQRREAELETARLQQLAAGRKRKQQEADREWERQKAERRAQYPTWF